MINKSSTQKFQEWKDRTYCKKRKNKKRRKRKIAKNGKSNSDKGLTFLTDNSLLVINDLYQFLLNYSIIYLHLSSSYFLPHFWED